MESQLNDAPVVQTPQPSPQMYIYIYIYIYVYTYVCVCVCLTTYSVRGAVVKKLYM